MREKYANTRLGRQELYAEILDESEGALWNYSNLDETRIKKEEVPEMKKIVVGIDPAVTSGDDSDETGMIVCGKGVDGRYYVLDDLSLRDTPDGWMRKAVGAYYKYQADVIIAETNNGGDLVQSLLRTIDKGVPYRKVHASRGKLTRAEPIAALYEQKKVSHCGIFAKLEEQLCFYTGDDKSPDRLDALVWALTELSRSDGQATWRIS